MGVLIAIEGTDSSGKQTQSELVYKKLTEQGVRTRLISFPAYGERSSELVKMYLEGEFGSNPEDVNAYAAATFYAVDRFATYRRDWKRDYDNGTVIIADRYVPSNMIHQAAKIPDKRGKRNFIEWVVELEYGHLELPVPNVTIFLDMPTESALKLMRERANKIDNSDKKDIHERNAGYLEKSHDNALYIAKLRNWRTISCTGADNIRTIDEINSEIMDIVNEVIIAARD